MPLSKDAKVRLISVHGWSATILGILLYVVMLTGTVAVFDHQIQHWSAGKPNDHAPFHHEIDPLVERFAKQVPSELRNSVSIGRGEDDTVTLFFTGQVKGDDGLTETYARFFEIDPTKGTLLRSQAGLASDIERGDPSDFLAEFIVDLHVHLHVPGRWGLYLTGISGVAMLVAAISGILIHRHIIREIFVTGRPGDRLVSFRDRHNLIGVWSLPFAILLAFTGAFLSFATSLGLPVVAASAFGGDTQKAIDTVLAPVPAAIEQEADPANLDVIFAQSEEIVGNPTESAMVLNYGLANAEVHTFHSAPDEALRAVSYKFDGVTGEALGRRQILGDNPSAGNTLAELVAPLHFGNFAGVFSLFVWAALGAAMTYTIVSGLNLWMRRRSDTAAWQSGPRVMSCVVWGLPLALVGSAYGFFLMSLTGGYVAGTVWGFIVGCFLPVLLCIAWHKTPVERVNMRLLGLLGVSLILLPLVRLQTGGMSWGEAVLYNGFDVLFIDTLCVIFGLVSLWYGRLYTPSKKPIAAPAE